jgi:hypothetical protein
MQLKEETGFREDEEQEVQAAVAPVETYRDSVLFQQMMGDLDLTELPNGQIVSPEDAVEFRQRKLLGRIGAITRMGCAECLREKLAQQRPLQEIAYLIMKVRYGAEMAEIYEPSPEFIADASALEKLIQEARGRSNPRYSVQGLAGA